MINKKNITKCGMAIVFLRRAFPSSSIWPGDELLVKTTIIGRGFSGYELYVNGGILSDKENGVYFIPEDDFLVVAGPKKTSIYLGCLKEDVENYLGIPHSSKIPKKIIIFKKLKKPDSLTDEWNNNWKPPENEFST